MAQPPHEVERRPSDAERIAVLQALLDSCEEEGDEASLLRLNLAVSDTSLFVRVGDQRSLTTSIIAGLMAESIAHTPVAAITTGAVAEIFNRFRRLTPEELAVFAALREEFGEGAIYRVWIDEERLLNILDGEMTEDQKLNLLASMKSRGILEEGAGKWRAVW